MVSAMSRDSHATRTRSLAKMFVVKSTRRNTVPSSSRSSSRPSNSRSTANTSNSLPSTPPTTLTVQRIRTFAMKSPGTGEGIRSGNQLVLQEVKTISTDTHMETRLNVRTNSNRLNTRQASMVGNRCSRGVTTHQATRTETNTSISHMTDDETKEGEGTEKETIYAQRM